MSKVVVTFTDSEDGQVDVNVDFGDEGSNDSSQAHLMAMKALTMLTHFLKENHE